MRMRAEADYWAGYRFRPRLIATTRGAAWVVEEHLPLLVRIDSATGEVGEPRRLTGSSERGAHELVSGAGAVWIRWNDGVTRIDAVDGSERWLPLSAASLAAGDAGVWALAGDGRVVRIDPAGGDYVTLGDAEVRRHTIAVGHGAAWTLTWTSVPAGSTLSRIDPVSGRVSAQVSLEGSPRRLLVDSHAIWARLWRHSGTEPVQEVLVRIDPRKAEPVGEIVVSPPASGGPVLEGVLWASDADPYGREVRGTPSTVRRIDARTGHLLGAVRTPGWVTGMTAGTCGVWGVLERAAEPDALIELSSDGLTARVINLGSLDISEFVPSGRAR